MKKQWSRFLAVLLCLSMVFSILPVQALADDAEDAAFNAALNGDANAPITFQNDATSPWTVATDGNMSYVQSTNKNYTNASITARVWVEAGAELTFQWDISANENHKFYFSVDGERKANISGEAWKGWDNADTTYTYTFEKAGSYALQWEFQQYWGVTDAGDTAARLANVEFTKGLLEKPASVQVSFDLGEHGSFTGGSPVTVDVAPGDTLTTANLPDVTCESDYAIYKWTPDPETYEIYVDTTFTPLYWSETELNETLNGVADAIEFTTGEEWPWVLGDADGTAVMESSNSGVKSTKSSVSARVWVEDGAELTFKWDVSCYGFGSGGLYFTVDGEEVEKIQHEDWSGLTEYTYAFPAAGSYLLEWYYNRDYNGAGDDKARLADVSVTGLLEKPTEVTVTFDAGTRGEVPAGADSLTLDPGAILTEQQVPEVTPKEVGDTFVRWQPVNPVGHQVYTDTTFTALFWNEEDLAAVNTALNAQDGTLEFTTGFNADAKTYPWIAGADGDGTVYAVSTNHGADNSASEASITVNVYAGATVSFDWRISAQCDSDGWGLEGDMVTFSVTDGEGKSVNGMGGRLLSGYGNSGVWTDWESKSFTFPNAGTYTLTWKYVKDASGSDGADMAHLKNIAITKIIPDKDAYDVEFFTDGNGTLTGDAQKTIAKGTAITDADVPTPVANEGYRFKEWTPEDPVGVTVDMDLQFMAIFAVDATIDEALNVPNGNITFTNDTTNPWLPAKEGNRVYMVSDIAGKGSTTSTITATVTAEAGQVLRFDWQADSEKSYDKAIFSVDGTEKADLSSETNGTPTGWITYAYEFEADGTYELSWAYKKDVSGNQGTDRIMLDNVALGNDDVGETEYNVTFLAGDNGKLYGNTRITVAEGSVLTADQVPTAKGIEGYQFVGWDSEPVGAEVTEDLTFRAVFSAKADSYDLDAALNFPGETLHFVNDETYPWYIKKTPGRVYAASGNAGVSDSLSVVSTTVTADAGDILYFDWDVCGEKGDDCVYFFVDGEEVLTDNSEYMGRYNTWFTNRYQFSTSGEHQLAWSYVKDNMSDYGDDIAVLDNILLTHGTPTTKAVTFTAGQHGALQGGDSVKRMEINHIIEHDEVPVPVADAGYSFMGWSPEAPTAKTVQEDVTYVANFVPTADIEGTATINLTTQKNDNPNHNGYVITLDNTATAYGKYIRPIFVDNNVWPEKQADADWITDEYGSMDFSAIYSHTCPEGVTGQCRGNDPALINGGEASITIPAGVYDWAVRQVDVSGIWYLHQWRDSSKWDDFEFKAGGTYNFSVIQDGFVTNVSLEVIEPGTPPKTYAISFTAGSDNGSVSDTLLLKEKNYVITDDDIPEATANAGYTFTGWSPTDPSGFTVVSDIAFRANFMANEDLDKTATVILESDDFWDDHSGYAMMLDADANTYGTIFSANTNVVGDAGLFDISPFEYTLPKGFNGSTNSRNVVAGSSVTMEIPAGVYDFCILNPEPNGRMYVATNNGDGGRHNDFEFKAGYVYRFKLSLDESTGEDKTTLTVTAPDWAMRTVNFVAGEHGTLAGSAPTTLRVEAGTKLTNKDIPVPLPDTGYEYTGWAPSSPVGHVVEDDITFTAQFAKKAESPKYTVAFAAGEGGRLEGNTSLEVEANTVLTAAQVPVPVADDGYEFSGWSPANPVGHKVTGAVTFTAQFTKKGDEPAGKYTVTFVAGTGGVLQGETSLEVEANTVLTAAQVPTPLAAAGYTFSAWSPTDPVGYTVTGNVTFTAGFTTTSGGNTPSPTPGGSSTVTPKKECSVVFAAGSGGTLVGETSLSVEGNTVLTADMVPTVVANQGYSFVKWMPADPVGYRVTADVAFVAVFQRSTDYTCDGGVNCVSRSFADVSHTAWYHSAIDYVVENELMYGLNETTFAPNGVMTRASMAAVLYRLEGSPTVQRNGAYSDVPYGQWYTSAVTWAAQTGIIQGYGNGTFGPNDSMTREQMAVVFFRYAQYKEKDTLHRNALAAFNDTLSVSPWALDAMEWAVAAGLISGKENSMLAPQGIATRAELAAVLKRFLGQ